MTVSVKKHKCFENSDEFIWKGIVIIMAKKDLMSGSTSYDDLKKTYADFACPTVKITIDGTDILESTDLAIGDMTVELTSLYEAGGATFEVCNAYDITKRSFVPDYMSSYFSLGKIVEIELGYIKTVLVFKGYINSVRATLNYDDLPKITIGCMDVKGSMMNHVSCYVTEKKSYSDVVKEICGKSNYKLVYKELKTDDTEELETFIELYNQTDYQFVIAAAKWYNYEFFMVSDTLYFRKPKAVTAAIMDLVWQEGGVVSFDREVTLDNLTSKVEVRGYDGETGAAVSATEESDKTLSEGTDAQKILGESKLLIIDSSVTTAAAAESRAKAELSKNQENFCTVTVKTVGIPEIIPGRFIKLSKFGGDLDQSYYIKRVRHEWNQDGYYTVFEGGITGL